MGHTMRKAPSNTTRRAKMDSQGKRNRGRTEKHMEERYRGRNKNVWAHVAHSGSHHWPMGYACTPSCRKLTSRAQDMWYECQAPAFQNNSCTAKRSVTCLSEARKSASRTALKCTWRHSTSPLPLAQKDHNRIQGINLLISDPLKPRGSGIG